MVSYGIFSVLSFYSTVNLRIDNINYPLNYLSLSVGISTIALLSFSLPFYLKQGFISSNLKIILNKLMGDKAGVENLSSFGFFILFLLSFGSLLSLIYLTDGGKLWITNPREAYLNHRSGFGIYYITYLYSLLILYLYTLFMIKPKHFRLIIITSIFFFFALFSGKKAFALLFFVISICYCNFNIKAFSLKALTIVTTIILAIIANLIYFGSGVEDNQIENILDYFNYADLTSEFLYRQEEFGYYLGKAFLTSFWVLVPRSLYAEKPYEYGASLVHEILRPGLAEAGHTAGYFMWIEPYLDFGILGVIITFIFKGWISRSIFEWYLVNKDSLFSFTLMMHFSLFEIWFFLPAPFAFLMCLSLLLISNVFKKLKKNNL